MKFFGVAARYALGITGALGMLAGCSSAISPVQESAGAGSPAQSRARGIAVSASYEPASSSLWDHRNSWMAPDAKKTTSLLSVADDSIGDV